MNKKAKTSYVYNKTSVRRLVNSIEGHTSHFSRSVSLLNALILLI
ncbi:hypothetical protein N474_22160 [Pseudoalteromonas luteoviolacea CPMOR-2]|nr:hypothetical protein N474_22160 [Pseudoalteromonas luteoviolacea CPMOR-2]MBE0389773.1 hypothetical protein [Pseudoalteromonas luteoviolacea DSM 6061]